MKSGDIRSFFGQPKNKSAEKKNESSQPSKPTGQDVGKALGKEDKSRVDDAKKRKANVFDNDQANEFEQKRLRKLKLAEDEEDENKIPITLPKKGTESQSKSKPTYTSDDLDLFTFGGNKGRGKTTPDNKRKLESLSKKAKAMEIEKFDDGGDSDKTEVLDEDDTPPSKPQQKPQTNVSSDKPKSLKDIANQYKPVKKVVRKDRDEEDEMEEEEIKPKKGGKGSTTAKAKGKVTDETIQGPFSGQTVVITGVLDGVNRDTLTDILKMLGAKVTGSVSSKTSMLVVGSILEDGRPVQDSRKYKTAEEKGTKILTESQFDDLLFQKTGNRIADGIDAIMAGASSGGGGASSAKGGSRGQSKTPQKSAAPTSISPAIASVPKQKPGEKSSELWTTKYAPKDVNDIIGNQSYIKEVMEWLKSWHDVVILGHKKEVKFNPGKNKENWGQSNVNAKACLISGPPGIGKTTTVRLIAKKLGYDIIEQNASDIRNKKSVEGLLNHLTDNQLVSYKKQARGNKKFLILMDECDGMSAGDRGGNQALINAIKTTKTPIICICNDRMHTKIRSLANHCYDIRFHKPPKQMVEKRMAEIAMNEGLSVDMNSLEYLCENFGNDIRQILNLIQMYSRESKTLTYMSAKNTVGKTKKDETVMLNNFEAARRLMTGRDLSIRDKIDLFFIDYDLIPLLVQENYLPNVGQSSVGDLEKMVQAADQIATGDILNRKIRQHGDWGLMPNFAFMSAIYPCEVIRPNVAFPKFPEWLGKNSSTRKKQRELKEIRTMTSCEITGNRMSVLFDYIPAFIHLLHYNIKDEGAESIENVVEILDHYRFDLEMAREYLPDLQLASARLRDPFAEIGTQTKAALTRTFNSRHKSSIKAKKSKRAGSGGGGESGEAEMGHKFNPEADEEEQEEEEHAEQEDEGQNQEDDSIEVEEIKRGRGGAKSGSQASKTARGTSAGKPKKGTK